LPISIHVPTRGTTSLNNRFSGTGFYFNPRPHKGDDQYIVVDGFHRYISIHVPTRGTTNRIGHLLQII